jgi:hypothetical protein
MPKANLSLKIGYDVAAFIRFLVTELGTGNYGSHQRSESGKMSELHTRFLLE